MTSTLITGPMFAQKSTDISNFIKKMKLKKFSVVFFKISLSVKRIEQTNVYSHDNKLISEQAYLVPVDYKFSNLYKHKDVVIIDEIQFFSPSFFVPILKEIVLTKKESLFVGLDTDSEGNAFETTALTCCHVDNIQKKTAVCLRCHKDAQMTVKLQGTSSRFEEDGKASYGASCRSCFYLPRYRGAKCKSI